jgi:hypothetical protein
MNISLNIDDRDVEVTWSKDMTPEGVIKYLAIVQKQLIADYISDPRELVQQLSKCLMQGLENPVAPCDFTVKGVF